LPREGVDRVNRVAAGWWVDWRLGAFQISGNLTWGVVVQYIHGHAVKVDELLDGVGVKDICEVSRWYYNEAYMRHHSPST
jgi:hypothetical protein